jgi:serine/threonine-protein kinase
MSSTPKVIVPPETNQDPLVGVELGGFRVTRLLAQGGMGLVYEAVHDAIGRRAAVKVLKPEIANDAAWTRRFLAEARVLGALKHRNLIEILNFGKTPDGREFLMMEFLDGEPLDYYLSEQGPLIPSVALGIIDQVLNGLSEAHKKGVVHRDLKPSNIYLLREHNGETLVKVLDFGLARLEPVSMVGGVITVPDSVRGVSIVAGTPEYIAPEQAKGLAVTPAADLYSLGIVLFEMLAGRLPFEDTGLNRLLMQHINSPPPMLGTFVENLPEGLEQLVDMLLAKEPTDRPGTADEVRVSVQRILKRLSQDATAVRSPIRPHTPRTNPVSPATVLVEPSVPLALPPAGPRRSPVAIAGGVVGVAVLAAVAWFSFRPEPPEVPPSPLAPSLPVANLPPAVAPVPTPVVVPHATPDAPPIVESDPTPTPVAKQPKKEPRLPICSESTKQRLRDRLELGDDLAEMPKAYSVWDVSRDPLLTRIAAAKTADECDRLGRAISKLEEQLRALGKQ